MSHPEDIVTTPKTTPDKTAKATAGAKTRNRNPYTPKERDHLKALRALATTTNANSWEGSPERLAGNEFAAAIQAKRDEGFTWVELGEPLGVAGRTLNAYMARRNPDPTVEPSRPKLKGGPVKRRARKPGYFPCGIHRVGVDPSYPPARPGGPLRDKICEQAARRKAYADTKADTPAEDTEATPEASPGAQAA